MSTSSPFFLSRIAVRTGLLSIALAGAVAWAGSGEQAARYYDDAQRRLARQDAAGAIVQARNAIQQEPGLLAAHLLLGKALLKDGQAAAAEAQFETALRLGASMGEVAVPYGTAMMMFGNSEKLLARIKPAGLSPSARAEVLAMRATAYADQGDMKEAFVAVKAARDADPRALAPLRAEISLCLRARDSARAAQVLGVALGIAPGDAQLLHLQGSLRQAAGDAQGALAAFSRALEVEPGLVDALIARASLLIDLQQPDKALPDLEQAARLAGRDPRVAYLKSHVFAARGDLKASRAQLEEVTGLVDRLPESFVARQPLLLMLGALANQAIGQAERAQTLLRLYVNRMPGDPAGRKLLANMLLERGEISRVADILEPLVSAGDADPQALTLLAAMRMQQRRFLEAAEALEAAARLGGGTTGITAQIGFARLANRQPDLGMAALRSAFDKEPGQLNVAAALATLYLRRGEQAKAEQVAEALVRRLPGEAAAHNLRGAVKAAGRQPAEARSAYEKALALAPGLLPAQLNLARLDVAEGRLDAARRRLAALLAKDSRNVQALTELGRLESAAGRLPEALVLLEKARALAPGERAAAMELLALYPRLNRQAEALALAEQLVLARPDDPTVQEALGRARLAVGDPEQAGRAFLRLARLAGNDADRLVAVGRLQLAAGDGPNAAASAERALAARPGFVPALVLQIEAELRAGAVDRADRFQRSLAQRVGKGAEVSRLAGDIAMARARHQDALRTYRAAFEAAPSSPLALRIFSAAYRAGQAEEGVAALESWLRRQPGDLVARGALAEASLRLGRLPAARAAYEAVLAGDPNNAAAANNLAQVLLRQNDAGALAMAERAVRIAPGDANALDTLGWLQVRGGALDVGLKTLREARLRAPESREIRYHLAWALSRKGMKDEACGELVTALKGQGEFESEAEARRLHQELGA